MERVILISNHWEFHEEGLPESVEWVVKAAGLTMEEFEALPEGKGENFGNTYTIDSIKFFPFTSL